MGVPKKRRSYTKRHMRRAHHALKTINTITCPTCGEAMLPHRVCSHCMKYRKKSVAVEQ